jgi:hypothetical protein
VSGDLVSRPCVRGIRGRRRASRALASLASCSTSLPPVTWSRPRAPRRYAIGSSLGGVNVEQLVELLHSERSHVLPFVGSGMAIGAGAPRPPALASALARRCGVELPAGTSLTEVTEGAEKTLRVRPVHEHLATMVERVRARAGTAGLHSP